MNSLIPLSYDLNVSIVPVTIAGKSYQIREMSGLSRDKYQDDVQTRFAFDDKNLPTRIIKHEGMKALLISLCLFDESGAAVPISTIQTWPSKVVDGLFAECSKLNTLNKTQGENEAAAKNG